MAKVKRCPHCGGENTRLVKAGDGIYLVAEILGFSLSLWIPVLGWVMMPVLLVMMLVTLFRMLVLRKYDYHFFCDDCKKSFEKMDKEQYKEYKSQGYRI